MRFRNIHWVQNYPRRADQAAVCAINRHLQVIHADTETETDGRSSGGVRDQSAPTGGWSSS